MKTDGDRLKLTKTMKISLIPILLLFCIEKTNLGPKILKRNIEECRSNILRRAICCTNILLFGIFYGILSTLFIHKS